MRVGVAVFFDLFDTVRFDHTAGAQSRAQYCHTCAGSLMSGLLLGRRFRLSEVMVVDSPFFLQSAREDGEQGRAFLEMIAQGRMSICLRKGSIRSAAKRVFQSALTGSNPSFLSSGWPELAQLPPAERPILQAELAEVLAGRRRPDRTSIDDPVFADKLDGLLAIDSVLQGHPAAAPAAVQPARPLSSELKLAARRAGQAGHRIGPLLQVIRRKARENPDRGAGERRSFYYQQLAAMDADAFEREARRFKLGPIQRADLAALPALARSAREVVDACYNRVVASSVGALSDQATVTSEDAFEVVHGYRSQSARSTLGLTGRVKSLPLLDWKQVSAFLARADADSLSEEQRAHGAAQLLGAVTCRGAVHVGAAVDVKARFYAGLAGFVEAVTAEPPEGDAPPTNGPVQFAINLPSTVLVGLLHAIAGVWRPGRAFQEMAVVSTEVQATQNYLSILDSFRQQV